jgi:hypothetical protein
VKEEKTTKAQKAHKGRKEGRFCGEAESTKDRLESESFFFL